MKKLYALFLALFLSAPSLAQDLSPSEVERALAQGQTLLNERGEEIQLSGDEAFVPGELLVRFRSGTIDLPQGRREAPLDQIGLPLKLRQALHDLDVGSLRKVFGSFEAADTLRTLRDGREVVLPDLSQTFLLKLPEEAAVRALAQRLADRPEVLYAEPNAVYYLSVEEPSLVDRGFPRGAPSPLIAAIAPEDPLYYLQWGLEQSSDEDIDAEGAWGEQTSRSDVRIAVLDSGIDYAHPDMGEGLGANRKVIGGYDYVGSNFDNQSPDPDPQDNEEHGTHVAGIAAALTNNRTSNGSREGIAGVAGGWGYDRRNGTGNKGAELVALGICAYSPRFNVVGCNAEGGPRRWSTPRVPRATAGTALTC